MRPVPLSSSLHRFVAAIVVAATSCAAAACGPQRATVPGPPASSTAVQSVPSSAATYPAAACFPFETLPPELQTRAEDMLLRALDSEALYTIASTIKPMSSGILTLQISVAAPALDEAENVRRILEKWTCGGEISALLHHFAAVFDGRRSLDVSVFNLPALRRLLTERAAFFAPYGLSASADPMEVAMAVDYEPTGARFRGYGLLFGYPDYAIDFFVKASDSEKDTKVFVERSFLSLPAFAGERRFVYAVPKDHQPNDADRALRARVEPVFADYSARRKRHITAGSSRGVLTLLREWFDDGTGKVRPSHAWK